MIGTKHSGNGNFIIFLFLIFWFLMNLLQSYFTGLANDEAYYWMYSRQLAWGYFDHPPMVALLINAGTRLSSNGLGVRFMFCILGTLTLLLIWKTSPGSPRTFIWIVSAMALVHSHVAGFLALPDIPLIFFTALFFCFYRQYLEKDSAGIVIMLSLAFAGMLYSKYHGLLVVIFVLLSNLSLLKRKSAWVIVGLAALAMVPHLMWQIQHGFPTFRYHLVTRSEGFDPENILNYLYSQALIAGPLIAPLVLYYSLSSRPKDTFERSLIFTLVGFLSFFFISSFRDHIEAHWTAAAYVPLIILAHASIRLNEKAVTWLRNLAIPSIVLLFAIRFMAAFDLVPYSLKYLDEFNGWDQWAETVREKAGGRKVVFLNKYQYAAKYSFYTGDISCSLNDVFARKSQYNLWNIEDSLAGKPVMLNKSLRPVGMIKTPNRREHGYSFIDSFQPYNRIVTAVTLPSEKLKAKDTLLLVCKLHTDERYALHYAPSGEFRPILSYTVCREDGSFYQQHMPIREYDYRDLPQNATDEFTFTFIVPEKPGHYSLYIVYWIPVAGQMGDAKPAVFTVRGNGDQ